MRSLLLSAALLAAPAVAQAPSTTAPVTTGATTTAVAKPGDKIVCRREEQLGSRLGGHRTCMKASEWEQMALEQRLVQDRRTLSQSPQQ